MRATRDRRGESIGKVARFRLDRLSRRTRDNFLAIIYTCGPLALGNKNNFFPNACASSRRRTCPRRIFPLGAEGARGGGGSSLAFNYNSEVLLVREIWRRAAALLSSSGKQRRDDSNFLNKSTGELGVGEGIVSVDRSASSRPIYQPILDLDASLSVLYLGGEFIGNLQGKKGRPRVLSLSYRSWIVKLRFVFAVDPPRSDDSRDVCDRYRSSGIFSYYTSYHFLPHTRCRNIP